MFQGLNQLMMLNELNVNMPAIPVCSSSFCDSLDEDAQLLQAHVSPGTHPDDTDAQPISI